MPDCTITAAEPADLDTILGFNLAMARETESVDLIESIVRKGVNALLQDDAKGRYFLARRDGEVAGQLMLTREWSDWRNAHFWWIQSVYVVPAHRRCGVFRALFDHVHTLAQDRDDVCGLRLYVEQDNTIAQQTYLELNGRHSEYRMMEWPFSRR